MIGRSRIDERGCDRDHHDRLIVRWTDSQLPAVTSGDTVRFTSVPARGSFDHLHGQVEGLDPADHAVAVFIYVPLALIMIALPALMYFLPERAVEKALRGE